MNAEFVPPEGYVLDELFEFDREPSRRTKRMLKYRHQSKRYTHFGKLSARKRRKAAASMNWKIKSNAKGGGLFKTHDILPGSKDYPGPDDGGLSASQWADFYFMSRKPLRAALFYNAMASTVAYVAAEKIKDLAEEAIEALMSEEDKHSHRLQMFSGPEKNGMTSSVFAPTRTVAALGDRTISKAEADWVRERWEILDTLVQVNIQAEIHTNYAHGVGLHMIVDERSIDVITVPRIINNFLDRGEVAFEEPANLKKCLGDIQAILESFLWSGDADQARATDGEEPDDLTGDAAIVAGCHSQPIEFD